MAATNKQPVIFLASSRGNAGGTEVAMMILDHYLYTQNASALQRYFPIVGLTLDFFDHHHKNRTTEGELVVWPTQALETCEMAATLSRLFRLFVLLTAKVSLLQTGAPTAPRPATVSGNDARLSSPLAMAASALTLRWAGTAPYFDKASNTMNSIHQSPVGLPNHLQAAKRLTSISPAPGARRTARARPAPRRS